MKCEIFLGHHILLMDSCQLDHAALQNGHHRVFYCVLVWSEGPLTSLLLLTNWDNTDFHNFFSGNTLRAFKMIENSELTEQTAADSGENCRSEQ